MSTFSGTETIHKNRELETTEWEDILVKKGIVEERPEIRQQRLQKQEIRRRGEIDAPTQEDQVKDLSLDELKIVEDDFDEDILERIRMKRIEELKMNASKAKYGMVIPMARADFVREVTDSCHDHWVVVEMFKDGIQESTLMSNLIREVARRKPECKFVRIRSTDCVDRWPDHSVPCLFLYHEGKMQHQKIKLDFCGGPSRASADTLEFALAKLGLFSTSFTVNPLLLSTEEIEKIREKSNDIYDGERQSNNAKSTVSALPTSATSPATFEDLSDDDW